MRKGLAQEAVTGRFRSAPSWPPPVSATAVRRAVDRLLRPEPLVDRLLRQAREHDAVQWQIRQDLIISQAIADLRADRDPFRPLITGI